MNDMNKSEFNARIVDELLRGQREPELAANFVPTRPMEMPPQLPAGNGEWLPFTSEGLALIDRLSGVRLATDSKLPRSISRIEVNSAMRRAYGLAFASSDIDADIDTLRLQVQSLVRDNLKIELSTIDHSADLVLGCWVLTGDDVPDLHIGPVIITSRDQWLNISEMADIVTPIEARRIRSHWAGKKTKKRKPSMDCYREPGIIDAIGNTQTVCVVETAGLTPKVAEEKGLLAARLSLAVLALTWETPSRAIERMGLLLDGGPRRQHTIAISAAGFISTFSGTLGMRGHFVLDDFPSVWAASEWLIEPLGAALTEFVRPSRQAERPMVMNALFLALWWFHEACREQSALMAIVKFVAALDTLGGGKDREGIEALVEARFGLGRKAILTKSGRRIDQVVEDLYTARSMTLHGSSRNYDHDWSDIRSMAERLSAMCLRLVCDWVHRHPTCDDISAWRRA